jgi:hypothetical protein
MCIMIMLNEYKVKHGFKLNKKKNQKKKMFACCSCSGYTWRIYASMLHGSKTFMIKIEIIIVVL